LRPRTSLMSGPERVSSHQCRAYKNESIPLPLGFDAVVGNPPYIRQEVIGLKGKRRIEARLARDRAASPDVFWPRWSGRSDIYVYFFAHSICFLKEHGRLVFLTASSWLDAEYGAALREFLLKNFRVISVIESATESFFADASINTCITVLEREADSRAREDHLIRFVRFNRSLSQILGEDRGRTARRADSARRLAAEIQRAGPHRSMRRIECAVSLSLNCCVLSRRKDNARSSRAGMGQVPARRRSLLRGDRAWQLQTAKLVTDGECSVWR